MTANQLKYANLLEDTRHNKVNETVAKAQVQLQKEQIKNQKVANIIDGITAATTVGKGVDTILKWFNVNG